MISQRIVNIFYHVDSIYKLTNAYKTERKYFEVSQALPNKVLSSGQNESKSVIILITNILQIIKLKKDEFLARSDNDPDIIPTENENFKTPQIFIEQMFQLYKKGLIDDKMMEDQVALMIFGVRGITHVV